MTKEELDKWFVDFEEIAAVDGGKGKWVPKKYKYYKDKSRG